MVSSKKSFVTTNPTNNNAKVIPHLSSKIQKVDQKIKSSTQNLTHTNRERFQIKSRKTVSKENKIEWQTLSKLPCNFIDLENLNGERQRRVSPDKRPYSWSCFSCKLIYNSRGRTWHGFNSWFAPGTATNNYTRLVSLREMTIGLKISPRLFLFSVELIQFI